MTPATVSPDIATALEEPRGGPEVCCNIAGLICSTNGCTKADPGVEVYVI